MPFLEKRERMSTLVNQLPQVTLPDIAITPEEKEKLFREIKAGRHPQTSEGVILHSKDTTKVKNRPDYDVFIKDILGGTGKHSERAGAFTYSLTPGGKEVGRVGTGFSESMREDMAKHPNKYKGRKAVVEALKQHTSGALHQPSFIRMHLDSPDKSLRKMK
jgi:ATP-dependent DNA ligase